MKKLLSTLALLGLIAAGTSSCVFVVDDTDSSESREICASCGEWYGSDDCCDADAARCDHCGMIAGSLGCCK